MNKKQLLIVGIIGLIILCGVLIYSTIPHDTQPQIDRSDWNGKVGVKSNGARAIYFTDYSLEGNGTIIKPESENK